MYFQRKLHKAVISHLNKKEYTIITGLRQSGKTSLLLAIYKQLKLDRAAVNYISLEDIDTLSAINRHPEEVFSFVQRPPKIIEKKLAAHERVFLLIDEIQYAANPSNILKYLFDTYGENLKLIVTGSSAFYIDTKFKDSLAGRKRIFKLNTLDFEEWLMFRKQTQLIEELRLIKNQQDYLSVEQHKLMNYFKEYLIFGGFPRVALEDDMEERILILRELKNSFLKKDINESGITNIEKFYNFLSLSADQIGNLVNRNELATTIGVDNKTIEKYLRTLQLSFHISLSRPFNTNLRKELTKMPKMFFADLGLRNITLNRFSEFDNRADKGALLENYVFNKLSNDYSSDSVFFWRTIDGKEVDFVLKTSFGNGFAYEVKTKCRTEKTTAIKAFKKAYPNYPLQIISMDTKSDCLWVLKI